jgi:uncharacterized membrane protein
VTKEDDSSTPLFLALCCWLFGGLGLLGVSLVSWTLRDGLGPNSVKSHSWLALTRFWRDAALPLLPWATPFVLGFVLYRWDTPGIRDSRASSRIARDAVVADNWADE